MFKLESYITPILLSYVDKYIKNFKPEDSQVCIENSMFYQNCMNNFIFIYFFFNAFYSAIIMGWRSGLTQFGLAFGGIGRGITIAVHIC